MTWTRFLARTGAVPGLRQHHRPPARAAAGRLPAHLRGAHRPVGLRRRSRPGGRSGPGRRRRARLRAGGPGPRSSHRVSRGPVRAAQAPAANRAALRCARRGQPGTAPGDGRGRAHARYQQLPARLASEHRSQPRSLANRTIGCRAPDLSRDRPGPRMRRLRMRVAVPRHQQSRPTALVQHGHLRQPGQGPPAP